MILFFFFFVEYTLQWCIGRRLHWNNFINISPFFSAYYTSYLIVWMLNSLRNKSVLSCRIWWERSLSGVDKIFSSSINASNPLRANSTSPLIRDLRPFGAQLPSLNWISRGKLNFQRELNYGYAERLKKKVWGISSQNFSEKMDDFDYFNNICDAQAVSKGPTT